MITSSLSHKYYQFIQFIRHYYCFRRHKKQYKQYLKELGKENYPLDGEKQYLEKWHQLTNRVEPYSYRFFSNFVGKTPYIVPEDIGHSIIEEILNPIPYRPFYSDKNMFPYILGKENLPKTIFFRINGGNILDDQERVITPSSFSNVLNQYSSVILKPSTESNSGKGVIKFKKEKDKFVYNDIILSYDYLMSFGNNFCLQECICQHDFFSQLNPTSINTLRLALYRSVKDEKVSCLSAILRVGKRNETIDNVHAGGMFVGIDIKNGHLGKYVFDEKGHQLSIWNDINYSLNDYYVPNWDNVKSFAISIVKKIKHHRLIALDLAINKDCSPIVIEYNINSFSYWLFMITGQIPLGEYTDEIIDYCKLKIK